MNNPLCDQERLEREISMKMTPGERLDWLAAAWDFVKMIEKADAKRKLQKKNK